MKHYMTLTKLLHYTSKFTQDHDLRHSLSLETSERLTDHKRFHLAPMWSEWNEAELNVESWEANTLKKKEVPSVKSRTDVKVVHGFEDPEGKVELPPSFVVEQWKRPIEFLPTDKTPVIVDTDFGIQTFDLITPNEHLHHSETMRKIISEITSLWDVCQRQRRTMNTTLDVVGDFGTIERTWRPWEHIYALNKVSKPPFITPYNPSGKYIVRLYFLGTWRRIIIDDLIPFDSQNRCLLPQTTLSHELWPMLLSKALLKIISLDFNASNNFRECNETSVIHALTGWIPEIVSLRSVNSEKVWSILRNEPFEPYPAEHDLPSEPIIPLYKWPSSEVSRFEEMKTGRGSYQLNLDETTKRFEDKKLSISKDPTPIKSSSNSRENRINSAANLNILKDLRRANVVSRSNFTEDVGSTTDDQFIPEASKMIAFATMSHVDPSRISSFGEAADRSEQLRRYNLNDSFSTSILLTSIRDIPLDKPQPPEYVPPWKLIRPRVPKILPHSEPIILQEPKSSKRWVEIASPYIRYPPYSVLNTPINSSTYSNRSVKHPVVFDHLNILELEEDENTENKKTKPDIIIESIRSATIAREDSHIMPNRDFSDESMRSGRYKLKCDVPTESDKTPQKSITSLTKSQSDNVSTKSKVYDLEQTTVPTDVQTLGNIPDPQIAMSVKRCSIKTPYIMPKLWMDLDDFRTCFSSIIIFHNPRWYHYTQKHTEIKFVPYPQPVVPTVKERKKDSTQATSQLMPILQDDKSSLYLYVESTRETLTKNIQLIISFTCLPQWYEAILPESVVVHDKNLPRPSLYTEKEYTDNHVSRNSGSLMAEIYSWKSLSIKNPIFRLHTTATKAAQLTLPPGRHVVKFTNACPFAFHVQVLCDTHEFVLGDEDLLFNKIMLQPENIDFVLRAEELFAALDDSIQNFHLINRQPNKLYELLCLYCASVSNSVDIDMRTCLNMFHQALYSTLRTMLTAAGIVVSVETQFAWRCFTNDLLTPDILAAYEAKRLSIRSPTRLSARNTASNSSINPGASATKQKTIAGRDRSFDEKTTARQQSSMSQTLSPSDVQEESSFDWRTRELNPAETEAITAIQKSVRGFLQRRISLARTSNTEKNLSVQQALQISMVILKADQMKSALTLFRNFLSIKPELIACFPFVRDDWNMVTYRDYNGTFEGESAEQWFVLFREIFYANEDSFVAARFLSHLPNAVLRVINNDTYDEKPLVFNRLLPGLFTKNKNGYTFFAEGMLPDQGIQNGRFRLRLITSYSRLPEPNSDQVTSAFCTREVIDYYVPNKDQVICRYRINMTDNFNQTGQSFHLASIYFSASKPDVFMRLTILDDNEEMISVEGNGSIVLPAVLFMRTTGSTVLSQSQSKSLPKTTGGHKKEPNATDLTSMNGIRLDRDSMGSVSQVGSNDQTGLLSTDDDEKIHKYIVQVTVLRNSWPLTNNQWQFVEQLKEQEKNELKVFNRQPSVTKVEEVPSKSIASKRVGSTNSNANNKTKTNSATGNKNNSTLLIPPRQAKESTEKSIDTTKAHWILRIVSDADKADELIVKKDTERHDELMNTKKAWETHQTGRAEKAMETRQRFLDSLPTRINDSSASEIIDEGTNASDTRIEEDTNSTIVSFASELSSHQVTKSVSTTKKTFPSTNRLYAKDEGIKQPDEPLLSEPPLSKSKICLPSLDLKPFLKRKLNSSEPVLSDNLFEKDDLQCRQNDFVTYSKILAEIYLGRQEDQNDRRTEKVRQLQEYVDLYEKITQMRRTVNDSREDYRQRLLEIERHRLQLLAEQEQKLVKTDRESVTKQVKKKNPTEKKKKK